MAAEKILDLTPSPRVLRMLGRIELETWQCLAELMDNSIDAITESGLGDSITVITPTMSEFDDGIGIVTVIDNGPGMSTEDLERNLRAGYSGNDPILKLGLFGMGFNIATARLGTKTMVMTTRKGDDCWRGIVIDFAEMERTKTFKRPLLKEAKPNREIHGTRVVVSNLDERVRTIRKQPKIKRTLNRVYTPILEEGKISISIDDEELVGRKHCVWGGERSVERGGRRIHARIEVDETLGEEYYCKNCWNWIEVPAQEDVESVVCQTCGHGDAVVKRKQQVKGWLGIQRFFDQDHYGIDLIRNGRVIEELDKSLFFWRDSSTGEETREYPIDTTHWGGRLVGEVHVNFVPITYTKDHFEKHDVRWKKVRDFLRGEGPFRPKIAEEKGYPRNESPLGLLFEGYRTGKPSGKKNLVPGRATPEGAEGFNAECIRWAEKFWEGDPEYQDDGKWWKAVEEAEIARRASRGGAPISAEALVPEGVEGARVEEREGGEAALGLEDDPSLTGDYVLGELGEEPIHLQVSKLVSGEIKGPLMWDVQGRKKVRVMYDPAHSIFKGFDTGPIDLILIELSQHLARRVDDPSEWPPSRIFSALYSKYCADAILSPNSLARRSDEIIGSLRDYAVQKKIKVSEEIPEQVQDEVRKKVLWRLGKGENEVRKILRSSVYLDYASDEEFIRFFANHPEEFFDGDYWDRPYAGLGSDDLREETKREFSAYLKDVLWLSREAYDYELEGISDTIRNRLLRASYSLRILEGERAGL